MSSADANHDDRGRSESVLTEKPRSDKPCSDPTTNTSTNTSTSTPPTFEPANHSAAHSSSPSSSPSPSPAKPLPTISDRLRSLTDIALRFVGNASNETLGACAVGLAASTYLVLGRLGLVLIGAFGGVLLTVAWDPNGLSGPHANTDSSQRKRELGAEIVKRALDWRDSRLPQHAELTSDHKVEASASLDLLDFTDYPPATASALTAFTDAVIRDYVKYWYSPVLPTENQFPTDCRQILVAFIHSLSNHVCRKRAADPFLDFIANSTSVIIVFLQELAVALKASQRSDVVDALTTYLDFQPDSNLAQVLDRDQQSKKLNMVAEDILQTFLDSKTYNCLPARSFLREVLAGLILDGTLISCSKPEWINAWIVYLLEEEEPALLDVIDDAVSELEQKAKDVGAPVEILARQSQHKRRVSRAEQAMQEAMLEAQRMNEMIAQEEAQRKHPPSTVDSEDALSTATTTTTTTDPGIATPTSSDEEHHTRPTRTTRAISNSMVFDSEGNAIPSLTPSPAKRAPTKPTKAFSSFDQLEQQLQPSPTPRLTTEAPARAEIMLAIPLTLHEARINIIDMGITNDQRPMKQKPDSDMMIQIEPASGRYPGWMVTRQLTAFESLHENLRRIANVSGVYEFNVAHPELPTWRGITRASLIIDLEQYLRSALKAERLAESESMKRFLDKDTGLEKIPSSQKNVFVQAGAGLENVGKGFVNVLGQGGKGLQTGFQAGGKVFQTGGKAVLGGVTGVLGNVTGGIAGAKRPGLPSNSSTSSISRSQQSLGQSPRQSQDLLRQSTEVQFVDHRPSRPSTSTMTSSDQLRTSKDPSLSSNTYPEVEEKMNLPPPPDMIADDYDDRTWSSPHRPRSVNTQNSSPNTPTNLQKSASRPDSPAGDTFRTPANTKSATARTKARPQDVPISEEETRMTVELIFAFITELLSLSSAWTFRLSLLTAAKTYLLRPNNPQLRSIRVLLQESIVDANVSDEGIATHIKKLRENGLPTEEELKNWPKEPSDEEKERLRVKARKLLVEKGMPQALSTVVGFATTGEALGKVFDCLQNREVARGLMFALMLQALRTVTQ